LNCKQDRGLMSAQALHAALNIADQVFCDAVPVVPWHCYLGVACQCHWSGQALRLVITPQDAAPWTNYVELGSLTELVCRRC
jgi:hypothetical protein